MGCFKREYKGGTQLKHETLPLICKRIFFSLEQGKCEDSYDRLEINSVIIGLSQSCKMGDLWRLARGMQVSNSLQMKKSSENDDLVKRLYESATLKLNPKERRLQRISNLMSIADDPSSEAERKEAERIIDEIYS